MSDGHQAKISWRSRRNSMSAISYVGSMSTVMDVFFSGSVGWTQTFFESRVVLKVWSDRDRPMSGRTLWSVSPLSLAYSAVMLKVCAIWWNSLTHMSETLNFPLLWWPCWVLVSLAQDRHSEGLLWVVQMLDAPWSRDTVMANPWLQIPIFSPKVLVISAANVEFDFSEWIVCTSWHYSVERAVCGL
jgi:hypothetical protein